jgi:hypothetical protein
MLEKFDGEGKVYYSEQSERKVEELIKRRVVQQKIHAFQIGAAIGILTNSRKALEGTPINFGNVYSLDNGNVLESVLLTRHPEAKTGKDRLELLQQYAESGIDVLYQEVVMHRAVDWEGLIARIRDSARAGQTEPPSIRE